MTVNAVRHRDGVRQAWSLPNETVISLGVHGELRVWNARRGEYLRTFRTPSEVLVGSLVGTVFLAATADDQLVAYDVLTSRVAWIVDLPDGLAAERLLRIEGLGAAHLALVAEDAWREERLYVLGPVSDVVLTVPPSEAVYGVPLREHAVVGGWVVNVNRVPQVLEPLRRGRKQKFSISPEARRKIGKVERRFCIAGDRLITIECDAMDYCDALAGGDRALWAWDLTERRWVGRVDVLDEIEGDGYRFPEEGDLDDPILLGAIGFPSGQVLSWGLAGLHLWSARTLKLEHLLAGQAPDGAFLLGDSRLIAWSEEEGSIFIWVLPPDGKGEPEAAIAARDFRPHQSALRGVCHLSGNELLSWSETDPVLRVWNLTTGAFVRGLGE